MKLKMIDLSCRLCFHKTSFKKFYVTSVKWPAQYVGQAQDGEAQTKKKKIKKKKRNATAKEVENKMETRSNISGRSDQRFGSRE